jgi:hypothetical protein
MTAHLPGCSADMHPDPGICTCSDIAEEARQEAQEAAEEAAGCYYPGLNEGEGR